MARSTRTKGGSNNVLHQAGFSGADRNRRAGGKVPCRIINDWAGHYTPTGKERRVPVLQGLSTMDYVDPENSGRFLPDSPGKVQTPQAIADSWARMSA